MAVLCAGIRMQTDELLHKGMRWKAVKLKYLQTGRWLEYQHAIGHYLDTVRGHVWHTLLELEETSCKRAVQKQPVHQQLVDHELQSREKQGLTEAECRQTDALLKLVDLGRELALLAQPTEEDLELRLSRLLYFCDDTAGA